jgi:hypothetical protein
LINRLNMIFIYWVVSQIQQFKFLKILVGDIMQYEGGQLVQLIVAKVDYTKIPELGHRRRHFSQIIKAYIERFNCEGVFQHRYG